MRRKSQAISLLVATALVMSATVARASFIDLAALLGNSGYENDLVHSLWAVTLPNATNYSTVVPVNPVINPLDPSFSNGTTLPALDAPAGDNFIGVLNGTLNSDLNGKLAHSVVAGSFAPGADTFQVTVWANRGRLGTNGNITSGFPVSPPTLSINLLGFNSVGAPTVDSSDNWTATKRLNTSANFINWGSPGQWTSQTFTFTNTSAFTLTYLTLTVTGQNHNHDQYVAWDISAVPEPSAVGLMLSGAVLVLLFCGMAPRRQRS